jgi:cytidylate kinase
MVRFVVSISAADAAGGGVIIPAVAHRLGVAHQPLQAPRSVPGAGDDALEDSAFRARSEREIEGLRAEGGVIRDAAAAIILAGDPVVLRVRLDGPLERRVRQGAMASGQTEVDTRMLLTQRDAAWAAYYRRFYGADVADPGLYHLVLDATALDWDLCADLITLAARARADGAVPTS